MSRIAPRRLLTSIFIDAFVLATTYLASSGPLIYLGHVTAWLLLKDVRVLCRDPTQSADFLIFLGQVVWTCRSVLKKYVVDIWLVTRTGSTVLWWAATLFSGFSTIIIVGAFRRDSIGLWPHTKTKNELLCGRDRESRLKPLIFPCRTTHTRSFPQRHSFQYSYLLVGIPVPWKGSKTGIISANMSEDAVTNGKNGWLSVRAEDYLERGNGDLGLDGKLRETLRAQGVDDSEWHEAYLVTASRVLGYSFNPVSFWYIYGHDQALKMMILEVNNTFDERRIYLLRAQPADEPECGDDFTKTKRFRNVWEKDFHVSPFNSRKGSYSLKATDPFNSGSSTVEIDNTITLMSSKNHAKLVARIFSVGLPLDPATFSFWDKVRFMARYWWVGLVTFPRIVREAAKLFFARGLHVWFRPEVDLNSIGRHASEEEKILECFFEQYISSLAGNASVPLQVTYKSALPNETTKKFVSPGTSSKSLPKTIEIRVLSPAFYSRFIHYAHTSEAFDRECLYTDQKNRTVWVSNPENLPLLLPKRAKDAVMALAWSDSLRWSALRSLRCAPGAAAYPIIPIQPTASLMEDIRKLPFSDMDLFVQRSCSDAALYRRTAMRVFLAQRIAFGYTELLSAIDILFRAILIVACMSAASTRVDEVHPAGSREWKWVAVMSVTMRIGAVHVWAGLKRML